MSRLIDADKVVERMSAAFKTQMEICDEETRRTLKLFIDFLEEVIPEQPVVDAVEVVRCKNCKYHLYKESDKKPNWCNFRYGIVSVEEDDYCSYGERKE